MKTRIRNTSPTLVREVIKMAGYKPGQGRDDWGQWDPNECGGRCPVGGIAEESKEAYKRQQAAKKKRKKSKAKAKPKTRKPSVRAATKKKEPWLETIKKGQKKAAEAKKPEQKKAKAEEYKKQRKTAAQKKKEDLEKAKKATEEAAERHRKTKTKPKAEAKPKYSETEITEGVSGSGQKVFAVQATKTGMPSGRKEQVHETFSTKAEAESWIKHALPGNDYKAAKPAPKAKPKYRGLRAAGESKAGPEPPEKYGVGFQKYYLEKHGKKPEAPTKEELAWLRVNKSTLRGADEKKKARDIHRKSSAYEEWEHEEKNKGRDDREKKSWRTPTGRLTKRGKAKVLARLKKKDEEKRKKEMETEYPYGFRPPETRTTGTTKSGKKIKLLDKSNWSKETEGWKRQDHKDAQLEHLEQVKYQESRGEKAAADYHKAMADAHGTPLKGVYPSQLEKKDAHSKVPDWKDESFQEAKKKHYQSMQGTYDETGKTKPGFEHQPKAEAKPTAKAKPAQQELFSSKAKAPAKLKASATGEEKDAFIESRPAGTVLEGKDIKGKRQLIRKRHNGKWDDIGDHKDLSKARSVRGFNEGIHEEGLKHTLKGMYRGKYSWDDITEDVKKAEDIRKHGPGGKPSVKPKSSGGEFLRGRKTGESKAAFDKRKAGSKKKGQEFVDLFPEKEKDNARDVWRRAQELGAEDQVLKDAKEAAPKKKGGGWAAEISRREKTGESLFDKPIKKEAKPQQAKPQKQDKKTEQFMSLFKDKDKEDARKLWDRARELGAEDKLLKDAKEAAPKKKAKPGTWASKEVKEREEAKTKALLAKQRENIKKRQKGKQAPKSAKAKRQQAMAQEMAKIADKALAKKPAAKKATQKQMVKKLWQAKQKDYRSNYRGERGPGIMIGPREAKAIGHKWKGATLVYLNTLTQRHIKALYDLKFGDIDMKEKECKKCEDEDQDGRHRSWVVIASEPGFYYNDQMHDVDEQWAMNQVEQFNMLTDQGYRPPVLAEHQRNGTRLGDVEALKINKTDDGKIQLLASVSWAIQGAEDLIKAGRMKYASPGFAKIKDERGRSFDSPYVLNELSVVSSPHQKSMGHHILNKEQTMNDNDLDEGLDVPQLAEGEGASEVAEAIRMLEAKLSELGSRLESLEKEYKGKQMAEDDYDLEEDEDEEEDEEEEDEEEEGGKIAQLQEQIIRLEEERSKDRFAMHHKDLVIGMSEDQIDGLFDAWQTSPLGFNTLVNLINEDNRAVESQIERTPWSVRLGESVDVGEMDHNQPTKADLHAQAIREAGGDKTAALALYKQMVKNSDLN